MNHIDHLKSIGACQSGIDMAARYSSLSEAWEKCEHSPYMFWLLRATKKITKEQAVDIAIRCAERRLSDWEQKHPDDKTARAAIDSAKAWLKEPTEENRMAARKASAAADAYAAAYAAAAAAAADAYASAYAAYAAAYAAYAAYAAAADDAAYDASERNAQADIIRSVVGNPFEDI